LIAEWVVLHRNELLEMWKTQEFKKLGKQSGLVRGMSVGCPPPREGTSLWHFMNIESFLSHRWRISLWNAVSMTV
jgi:hypothetical protein